MRQLQRFALVGDLLRFISLSSSGKNNNLSHDGLIPAHVPYWRVDNPTLGEFCLAMIGRADIEGSKSTLLCFQKFAIKTVHAYPGLFCFHEFAVQCAFSPDSCARKA